jgi:hypothetical protein
MPFGGARAKMHQEVIVLLRIPNRMDQGGAIGFSDPETHQARSSEKSVESGLGGGPVAGDSTNRYGHAPVSLVVMARTPLQRRPAVSEHVGINQKPSRIWCMESSVREKPVSHVLILPCLRLPSSKVVHSSGTTCYSCRGTSVRIATESCGCDTPCAYELRP